MALYKFLKVFEEVIYLTCLSLLNMSENPYHLCFLKCYILGTKYNMIADHYMEKLS